jgi:hypothetical protein
MLTSIQGIYQDGRIEIAENPTDVPDGALAIVTFMGSSDRDVDLAAQGINPEQARILQANLATFADDWNSPEMDIYDDYDAAHKETDVITQ